MPVQNTIDLPDFLRVASWELHNGARFTSRQPIEVLTPAPQWSYAASVNSQRSAPKSDQGSPVLVTIDIHVSEGRVGVGWTMAGSDDFVVEKHVTPQGPDTVTIHLASAHIP